MAWKLVGVLDEVDWGFGKLFGRFKLASACVVAALSPFGQLSASIRCLSLCSETHPVTRQTIGTLNSSDSDFVNTLKFSRIFLWVILYAPPKRPWPKYSEKNYHVVADPLIYGGHLSWSNRTCRPYSTTTKFFSPFKLIEQLDLGFRVPPRFLEAIVNFVGGRARHVMRRRYMRWYLQSSDQGTLINCKGVTVFFS